MAVGKKRTGGRAAKASSGSADTPKSSDALDQLRLGLLSGEIDVSRLERTVEERVS